MRWALPVFLLCFVWMPGAANAVGDAERRPAGATLPVVVDFALSWSADGTRIGFTRLHFGLGTISADGSDERWIEDEGVIHAALSPDGEWFAFVSYDRDPIGLWTIRTDGSEARFLLRAFDPPVWSPDSRGIAIQAPDGVLWVVDRDGGGSALLASSGVGPTWSPDSRRIALRTPDGVLWVVDGDGGGSVLLAPSGIDPTWSPDGEWIAFSTRRAGDPPNIADLMVVDSTGGAPRVLVGAAGDQIAPKWSPDGTLIAYLDAVTAPLGVPWRLGVVRPDGSGLRVFSDGRDVGGLAWMPDSRRLVVPSDGGVVVRDVESGRMTVVAPYGGELKPSPDDTRIAFSANGECFHYRRGIHVVGVDGKELRRLTNHCRIFGTAGPDELRSSAYPEELHGLGGDDRLYAFGGDTLEGGAGDDLLVGDYGSYDHLRGGAGRDVLLGRSGFDILTGGPGRDRIEGGRGRIFARDGERDTIDCGTMLNGQVREHGDRVWADFHDVVSRDCDIVRYPRP